MRNKFAFVLVCTLLIAVVLGCSSINPLSDKGKKAPPETSNKSLTDKGVDTVVGTETTSIPECDEVLDIISAEANNPDDSYIIKAGKGVFLNKIKESIKKAVQQRQNDNSSADLAKTCADLKIQLEKYKAEAEKTKAE